MLGDAACQRGIKSYAAEFLLRSPFSIQKHSQIFLARFLVGFSRPSPHLFRYKHFGLEA